MVQNWCGKMTKTFGAKDIRKRKRRKKKKILKPFPKKEKGRKTVLKLYIWEIQKMSLEGYRRLPRRLRPYTRKIIYKPFIRVDANVERLSSIDHIKELALEVIGCDGTFIIRGISHGKTKTGFKWVRLAVVKIKNTSNGLKAFVSETGRLSRYWFYRKE